MVHHADHFVDLLVRYSFADIDENVPNLGCPNVVVLVQIKGPECAQDLIIGKVAILHITATRAADAAAGGTAATSTTDSSAF